mgnify:CR=1 FL=1
MELKEAEPKSVCTTWTKTTWLKFRIMALALMKNISRGFSNVFTGSTNTGRVQGGSGLGLAIVKHIIEAHNQTINVRSAPGVGSTFSFTLQKV